jgi:hypothetical protein
MKLNPIREISLLFFCLNAISLFSQTNIGAGNVSGTWTKSGSPYKINGDVVVPDSQILTIEPGVVVEFAQDKHMKVYGSIRARGKASSTDSIWFKNSSSFGSTWKGIKILNPKSNNDSSVFQYCVIKNTKNLFDTTWYMQGGSLVVSGLNKIKISHCAFYNNESTIAASIYLTNRSKVTVESCLFAYNKVSRFWYQNNGVISGSGAGSTAVTVDNRAKGIIKNCRFNYNKLGLEYGNPNKNMIEGSVVFCFSPYNKYAIDSMEIDNCVFDDNEGDGVRAYGGSKVQVKNSQFINSSRYYSLTCINSLYLSIVTSSNNYFYNNGCNSIYDVVAANFYSYNDLVYKNNEIARMVESRSDDGVPGLSYFYGTRFISNKADLNNSSFAIVSTKLSNCLIANNTFDYGFRSKFIENCHVVNNKTGFSTLHFLEDAYVKNTVLWGNKNDTAGGRQIVIAPSKKVYFNNNIIENDTANFFLPQHYGAVKPVAYNNNLNQDPLFKNPTASYGHAYDALNADFSLVNTCQQQSPAINAGSVDTQFLILPKKDLKGNVRFYENRIDIGAYEDNLGSATITIQKEPQSDSLCFQSRDAEINLKALGQGLNYQWQFSTDNGNTWSKVLNAPNNDTLVVKNPSFNNNHYLYRALLTGTCDTDSSESVQVKVFDLPQLDLGKDSTVCIHQSFSKSFSGQGQYVWQDGSQGKSLQQVISKDTTWTLMYTDSNLCVARDTLNIMMSELPNIDLGSDQDLDRKATLTLDAGAGMRSYLWNDGSKNQTRTFKGEDLGADGPYILWAEVSNQHACLNRDSIVITVVNNSSIDLKEFSFIKLYPNPSQGWVMIEQVNGETIQLEVYSSDAQLVMSKQIEGSQLIDLRDLSPGVYVFRFTAEKGVSEMKIVID